MAVALWCNPFVEAPKKTRKTIRASFCRMRLGAAVRLYLCLLALYQVLRYVQPTPFFIFDPDVLHKCALQAVAFSTTNTTERIDYLMGLLREIYPGRIVDGQIWSFNNAGGVMGSMVMVHVSVTEYIIIFGTALGSNGHSGRFLLDDYFMVLEGEQWTQRAGDTEMWRFEPGSINHLPKGEAFQYRMPGRCYAMEYARGWIPTMMPFGIVEVFTSTLDFHTLWKTLWIYTKLVTWNLVTGKV